MSNPLCDKVQGILAELGPTAFQKDEESRIHLESCEHCFAFMEALAQVDAELLSLPPYDAPQGLVNETLAGLELTQLGVFPEAAESAFIPESGRQGESDQSSIIRPSNPSLSATPLLLGSQLSEKAEEPFYRDGVEDEKLSPIGWWRNWAWLPMAQVRRGVDFLALFLSRQGQKQVLSSLGRTFAWVSEKFVLNQVLSVLAVLLLCFVGISMMQSMLFESLSGANIRTNRSSATTSEEVAQRSPRPAKRKVSGRKVLATVADWLTADPPVGMAVPERRPPRWYHEEEVLENDSASEVEEEHPSAAAPSQKVSMAPEVIFDKGVDFESERAAKSDGGRQRLAATAGSGGGGYSKRSEGRRGFVVLKDDLAKEQKKKAESTVDRAKGQRLKAIVGHKGERENRSVNNKQRLAQPGGEPVLDLDLDFELPHPAATAGGEARASSIGALGTIGSGAGGGGASSGFGSGAAYGAKSKTKKDMGSQVLGGLRGNTAESKASADAPINHSHEASRLIGLDKNNLRDASPRPLRSGDHSSLAGKRASSQSKIQAVAEEEASPAHQFMVERNRTQGHIYKEATGYWANTYVPGDQILQASLSSLQDLESSSYSAQVPKKELGQLQQNSKFNDQPFDEPDNGALAVYLHSDRVGIDGESRALVQVGLKGTSRRSGSRPVLNIGLVLDLRNGISDAAFRQDVESVLEAFRTIKSLGDRFTLTVVGRPGGTLVAGEDFRYGPLKVAMDKSFDPSVNEGRSLTLIEAFSTAQESVIRDDDPTAALGSSAVIVLTPGSWGNSIAAQLEALAHKSAVEGVAVSVMGLGKGSVVPQVHRQLALAGQGSVRRLSNAESAEALVQREITAVSRIVARALRLKIRLAPGVKLIDVLGSYNLDEAEAQRVREAEQSIDQRISRNLGIQADRGEDEEGIQIVIPAFYAGDEHVILLDVVAPGPGPIADVTLRYKDLVHLRNGVAQTNFELSRQSSEKGPMQWMVLNNLLVDNTTTLLQSCAVGMGVDPLAMGYDPTRWSSLFGGELPLEAGVMEALLREQVLLLRAMNEEHSALKRYGGLESDAEVLEAYIDLLQSTKSRDGHWNLYLGHSMSFTSLLRNHPSIADLNTGSQL